MATALGSMGWIEWSSGNPDTALRHLEEGVDLARELGDRWLLARALYLLAHVYAAQASPIADEIARESLGLARELGEKSIEGRGLYFLGVTAIQRGEYDEARGLLEASVALAREVGDRWQAPWSLSFIGVIDMLCGNFAEAAPALEESLALARETGNTWCTARCTGALAWVTLLKDGDVEKGCRAGRVQPSPVSPDRHPHRHWPRQHLPRGVRPGHGRCRCGARPPHRCPR